MNDQRKHAMDFYHKSPIAKEIDLESWAVMLEKRAIELRQIQTATQIRKIQREITSQHNPSEGKAFKSIKGKLENIEKVLDFEAAKAGRSNQAQKNQQKTK